MTTTQKCDCMYVHCIYMYVHIVVLQSGDDDNGGFGGLFGFGNMNNSNESDEQRGTNSATGFNLFGF